MASHYKYLMVLSSCSKLHLPSSTCDPSALPLGPRAGGRTSALPSRPLLRNRADLLRSKPEQFGWGKGMPVCAGFQSHLTFGGIKVGNNPFDWWFQVILGHRACRSMYPRGTKRACTRHRGEAAAPGSRRRDKPARIAGTPGLLRNKGSGSKDPNGWDVWEGIQSYPNTCLIYV